MIDHDLVFNLLVDSAGIERSIIGEDRDLWPLFKRPFPSEMNFVTTGYGLNYYKYTPVPKFSSFCMPKGKERQREEKITLFNIIYMLF